MTPLPQNSPEAMARILAMLMMADGNMDDRELELLEKLKLYDIIGLSRKQFIEVLHQYCDELEASAEQDGTIHLVDRARIDELLDTIDEPKKRLLLCAMVLDLSKADADFSEVEMAIFTHMLDHWHLTLEDLETAFAGE
ncbi:putative tellurite resistance protein B-like protein [Chitinivorax tropicus]|uniref:Putative tellurite resistance protein B-like protein n=1 Tax=Chitinivorax tropicus TaxID=714531 RepID=A0A840MTA6_9PROT|nr:hypothetical protein [Chitinivorax tropicus]MBB5020012.1 putative tellurite resistance protein B-like protein [Chitinivorax tropicus]